MVLDLFWNPEKTATGDSLTLFASRSSSQKLDVMSSSCSANVSERRMTGQAQEGRKEWDDGRSEELGSGGEVPYVFVTLTAESGDYENLVT